MRTYTQPLYTIILTGKKSVDVTTSHVETTVLVFRIFGFS